MLDFVCAVLLVEQADSRWAVYGCGCGSIRQDVGFGEKEVSKPTSFLLAMERGGET